MTDSLLARGFYCSLRMSLSGYLLLPSILYSYYPIDKPAILVFRIGQGYALASVEVSNFSIYTYGYGDSAICQ